MALGTWTKFAKLNPWIVEILKQARRHMTTNEIRDKIFEKHKLKVSWQTINKYLEHLKQAGHITSEEIQGDKNMIHTWQASRK